jgi:hypothetical protein
VWEAGQVDRVDGGRRVLFPIAWEGFGAGDDQLLALVANAVVAAKFAGLLELHRGPLSTAVREAVVAVAD